MIIHGWRKHSWIGTCRREHWSSGFTDLKIKEFTLADAVSFAVMNTAGITTAFTFDDHFKIAGFRTVPEDGW